MRGLVSRLRRCIACAGVAVACATPVSAQEPKEPPPEVVVPEVVRPGRLELSLLGGLFGGGDLGDSKALMLTNQVPTGGTTPLFTTSARMDAAPLIEGRVGWRLGRNLWVEGGASYARPDFVVDLAGDAEEAPDAAATSMLTQVTVDGSLQYRWTRPGRRIVPFVMGGAGYLRQLDDTRATAETGWLAQGGGGVLVRLSTRPGFLQRLAIRGDARAVWLRDAIVLNQQHGATFTVSAGMTLHLGGMP